MEVLLDPKMELSPNFTQGALRKITLSSVKLHDPLFKGVLECLNERPVQFPFKWIYHWGCLFSPVAETMSKAALTWIKESNKKPVTKKKLKFHVVMEKAIASSARDRDNIYEILTNTFPGK